MATTAMTSVGEFLRELRTRRGVSLDEIARKTRVAQRYLEALEADAFEDLPQDMKRRLSTGERVGE